MEDKVLTGNPLLDSIYDLSDLPSLWTQMLNEGDHIDIENVDKWVNERLPEVYVEVWKVTRRSRSGVLAFLDLVIENMKR